jgi:uncharacterized protein (DUF4415 family)
MRMLPSSASLPREADKVLLRAGPHAGKRGTIEAVDSHDRVVVALVEGGRIETRAADIRNFSAAARKAWNTTPTRPVGRPAGRSMRRVSVTLRLDSALWERFRRLESLALIESRSEFLEQVLGEAVARTEDQNS